MQRTYEIFPGHVKQYAGMFCFDLSENFRLEKSPEKTVWGKMLSLTIIFFLGFRFTKKESSLMLGAIHK